MNPWDEVRQLRWARKQAIVRELLAHEIHLADPTNPEKVANWRKAMEAKAVVYRGYRVAVRTAITSKVPHPGT